MSQPAGLAAVNMPMMVDGKTIAEWKAIALYVKACYILRACALAPECLCMNSCTTFPTFAPERLCGLNGTFRAPLHGF